MIGGQRMLKRWKCRCLSTMFVLPLWSLITAACNENIKVSLRACLHENGEPREEAVLPYSKEKPPSPVYMPDSGPFITIVFSTPADLESLGKRKEIHHLYYKVFACSSDPFDAELCSGDVYKATPNEGEGQKESEAASGEGWYKIYIPNRLSQMGKCGENVGGLDVAVELEKIRSTGLCIVIGGGNMLGGGLWSNSLRVPVALTGDSLEINQGAVGVQEKY